MCLLASGEHWDGSAAMKQEVSSGSFCIKFCYLLSEWFFSISVKACCITFQGHLVIRDFVEVIEFGTPCRLRRFLCGKISIIIARGRQQYIIVYG